MNNFVLKGLSERRGWKRIDRKIEAILKYLVKF
jgi:hypothetical protein